MDTRPLNTSLRPTPTRGPTPKWRSPAINSTPNAAATPPPPPHPFALSGGSIDYDPEDSEVQRHEWRHLTTRQKKNRQRFKWLLLAAIGVLTAAVAYGVEQATGELRELRFCTLHSVRNHDDDPCCEFLT